MRNAAHNPKGHPWITEEEVEEIINKVDSINSKVSAIEQKSGKTGEEAGGYAKAEGAKDINFMIIHKAAVIQFAKHIAPKIIEPSVNQSSDGYKFGYRKVAIADVYENKVAGIYLHHKA